MAGDNLEGRSAIVTGGGSGIGRAIALELAAAGVNVLIAGRREKMLTETVAASAGPGRIVAFGADIREPNARHRLVEAAMAAVSQMRYVPAEFDGVKVPQRIEIVVPFASSDSAGAPATR